MEVTFLSSTGSFGGVAYNLGKVTKNAGELMEALNFDGLKHISNPTIGDYTEYLKAWSDRNSRIKNSQLHVALSCRGKEKSKGELLSVAKEWLKEMGYEGIPALFVFHHDTDNNHIHIITSRVSPNGKKVADNNERWRGRAILKRLEGVRLSEKDLAQKAIDDALTYKFSNKQQFMLVLESKRYKVIEQESGDISVLKYGKEVGRVTSSQIDELIGLHENNKGGRGKQIKALLYKYKDRMDRLELQELMRKSFAVELVFFGKADKPYGYAIIDHKEKVVYKGGDVMPLKELLDTQGKRNQKTEPTIEKAESLVSLILEGSKASSKEINRQLRKYGYNLRQGQVYHYGQQIGTLKSEIQAKIDYNDRLERTRRIITNDPKALDALANHFKLERSDLDIAEVANKPTNRSYISLQDLYDQAFRTGELFYHLKLNDAFLIKDQGRTYLVQQDSASIAEINTSNPERSLVVNQSSSVDILSPDVTINEVASLIAPGRGGIEGGGNNEPRRRKKKR